MQPFIAEKRGEIAELCRKHYVKRLSVFGSAVRADFDPATSDVDVLVAFTSEAEPSYAKNFYSLENNLIRLFDRRVDLITEGVIKNPYRLRLIEADKVLLYAA